MLAGSGLSLQINNKHVRETSPNIDLRGPQEMQPPAWPPSGSAAERPVSFVSDRRLRFRYLRLLSSRLVQTIWQE